MAKIKQSKSHPWKRVQTTWAFKAWARKNVLERIRLEYRFKQETK